MDSLIAANVSRLYSGHAVVDDVSLTLEPGQVTALLGGSGAGKSTLLRLFAGLEPIDAGEIKIGSEALSSPTKTTAAEKRRIGLVFQDFALFPHLSAEANVMFGLRGMSKADAKTLASEWLARLGLSDRATAYPHQLSGGEQQRVAIARALAPAPRAILLDEPFSGLDPALREDVRAAALSAIKEAGVPALLVTHDASEALSSADHIAIMRNGRIVQQGTAETVYMSPVDADTAAALGPVTQVLAADLPASLTAPLNVNAKVHLCIREEAIRLDPDAPTEARIVSSHLTGPLTRIVLDISGQQIAVALPRMLAPAAGNMVRISLNPALVFAFSA